MKFIVKDIELYLCEEYVMHQRCLGRWTARNEKHLKERIFDFIGYHVEFIDYEVKA